MSDYIGIPATTPNYKHIQLPVIKDEPFYDRDYNLCIDCRRCLVACNEVRGVGCLEVKETEGRKWVGTIAPTLIESGCKFCSACVTVCPTGASYKRGEDGIVLVDESMCIGCKLCSWACPYGAREYSEVEGVMKKCTLCVDRIYNENLDQADRQPACVQACPTKARHFGDLGDPTSKVSLLVADRGGVALMPELDYKPVNRYLPPRPRRTGGDDAGDAPASNDTGNLASRWLNRILKR